MNDLALDVVELRARAEQAEQTAATIADDLAREALKTPTNHFALGALALSYNEARRVARILRSELRLEVAS